jgi:transglutaminase-like putative cysteine protease
MRGGILSDPVVWAPGEPPPVANVTADGEVPWDSGGDGTFYRRFGGRTPEYVQYTRVQEDPDLGPAFEYEGSALAQVESRGFALVVNPVPRVKDYADGVLAGMVKDGRLPADFRDPIRLLPRPEFREGIARVFTRHLSNDAGLTYSTVAKRDRPDLDPVEDFLFHSKVGHCQQFASALVLMLRSQGIPTQLVHGFRGCEGQGAGRYLVRHEHAHVWGEALVWRPKPGEPGKRVWHWLSVDPSPTGPAPADAGVGWWESAMTRGRLAFNQYFLQYDPDQRDRLLSDAVRGLRRPPVLAGLAAVVVAVLAGVALRKRQTRVVAAGEPSGPARWFDRLTAALAPYGFVPEPGDTPREFADRAAAALRHHPATAAFAEVPTAWAAAYYETRFGGVELTDGRRSELEASLAELCRALAG